jgi:hypothetical protein
LMRAASWEVVLVDPDDALDEPPQPAATSATRIRAGAAARWSSLGWRFMGRTLAAVSERSCRAVEEFS